MTVHYFFRFRVITRRQRCDDLPVFIYSAVGGVRPAVERENESASRRQLADILCQRAAASHLRQKNVKLRRKPDRALFGASARLLLVVDVGRKSRDLGLGQGPCQPFYHHALNANADFVDVARLFPTWLRHGGAAIGSPLSEAIRG